LSFAYRLVERNLVILARREAAIRIERDPPPAPTVLQGLLQPAHDDLLGRIDLGKPHIDAAQADLHVRRQLPCYDGSPRRPPPEC
jgi:hypothetical protein